MQEEDVHRYDDIIELSRYESGKHPRMSLMNRAAQFAPFAALTGHEAAIKETERLTEAEAELDEGYRDVLDRRFRQLREHLPDRPEVTVTYFRPDERKSGGAYVTVTGTVKKADEYKRELVFSDNTTVSLEGILWMEGELFDCV